MTISKATGSPWPARVAYFSAAIFIGASGSVNLLYGLAKGTDPASSAVWGAVSVAASITFALSWPALIRSRSLSGAIVAIVALLLSGGYSISAALGSAGAGRMDAAAQEKDSTGTRKRAQDAYDTAKAELATLKPSRTLGELLAMKAGWVRAYPNQAWALEPELARAKRRAELETAMATASGQLATTPAGRVANADAEVLARYLGALGAEIGPDRLNDLLVLLTVALLEMGGGLCLALGLALSGAPASPTVAGAATPTDRPTGHQRPRGRPLRSLRLATRPLARPAWSIGSPAKAARRSPPGGNWPPLLAAGRPHWPMSYSD